MENGGENIICRLCFEPCECIFEHVETVTIQMLRLLGLELGLNASGEPAICKTCSENLEKCFDFKTACLLTEDCINSFRKDGDSLKLDLREIYVRKNENEYIAASKCRSICRLCMDIAESGCHVALNDLTIDTVLAKTILEKYFSELDLNVTKDPVICISCSVSLYTCLSFMKKCWHGKEETKMYCEIEESNNKCQGKSNREIQFSAENVINYRNDNNDPDECKNGNGDELGDEVKIKLENLVPKELHIKREVIEYEEVDDNEEDKLSSTLHFPLGDTNIAEKCHEIEQNIKTELKYENFVVPESCELEIKHEEIDIKTEDGETARLKDSSGVEEHMLIHKNICEVARYQCDICVYKTKWKKHLKRHMLVHKNASERTKYSCERCTYKTKQKSKVRMHMLIHKDASEVTMYSCEICTFKTKYIRNLRRHMLIHKNATEVTMYSCERCTYKTKEKNKVRKHMLIHKDASEVTMYSCEICTFKSKHIRSLRRHMLLIHKNA